MNALLHLTHDCNLRCPYCFTGKKFDREMTADTAKRTAEFVVDYAKEHGQRAVFSFFGGEPMMAWERMQELVLHAEAVAKAAGVTAIFRMNTNGLLIKEEHLRFFEEHDLIFILSIDGNEAMHDAERKTEGGQGSFAPLAKKLPRFLEHNPGLMASVVITPTNLPHAADGLRFLLDTGFRYLIIKPDVTQVWTREHVTLLEQQYELIAEDYLARTRAGEEIYINLFDDKWINHAKGAEGISIRCDVGTSQISISPSGNIYPCVRWVKEDEDTVPRLGDVWQGMLAEPLAKIRAESAAPKQPCGDCSYNDGRCANECACEHYSATGRIDTPAPALCEHERVMVPIADRIGNTLWKEQNPVFLRKLYPSLPSLAPNLTQIRVERPLDDDSGANV
ncbi:MAG: 4Fe-4S cluster-binding domain-containing protein [Deltaproteobacteria bacterium]|nr:4Fe-4S cluster-binding domain-containing protein [Deltaproteobacteria bacterium]